MRHKGSPHHVGATLASASRHGVKQLEACLIESNADSGHDSVSFRLTPYTVSYASDRMSSWRRSAGEWLSGCSRSREQVAALEAGRRVSRVPGAARLVRGARADAVAR